MKTRPKTDPQQTAQCSYSIPCECGRRYIGETGRPLAMRFHEHGHNHEEDILEKSKLSHMPVKRVTQWAGIKLEFWKMKVIAGIGNTMSRHICNA
jgi:hypothetical protein